MVDVQSISITLAALSFVVAAIYYVLTLRNNQRAQQLQLETRQAQLFMQIYNRFNTLDFTGQMNYVRFRWTPPQLDDMRDFFSLDEFSEDNSIIGSVMYFFEGIGVLVSKGLIDVELVDDLMSGPLTQIWERMLPVTMSMRELVGPQAGEWYEYLYDKVKPMRGNNT